MNHHIAAGALLRRERLTAGVGLRDLARRLGVSHVAVLHWEQGKSGLPLRRMLDLPAALGVVGADGDRLIVALLRARVHGTTNVNNPRLANTTLQTGEQR